MSAVPKYDPAILEQHGLNDEEYRRIVKMLGREPTLTELGVRGVQAPSWYSLVAPAAMPREAVAKLHGEIVGIAARPDYREPLEKQALEPTTTTPEQFAVFLKGEYDKWGKVVKSIKID